MVYCVIPIVEASLLATMYGRSFLDLSSRVAKIRALHRSTTEFSIDFFRCLTNLALDIPSSEVNVSNFNQLNWLQKIKSARKMYEQNFSFEEKFGKNRWLNKTFFMSCILVQGILCSTVPMKSGKPLLSLILTIVIPILCALLKRKIMLDKEFLNRFAYSIPVCEGNVFTTFYLYREGHRSISGAGFTPEETKKMGDALFS